MVKPRAALFAALIFLGAQATAFAAGEPIPKRAPAQPNSGLPAPIAAMLKSGQGVRFQDKFESPGGLTGYVLSASNGERRIYYVTPDKRHAILGILIDENLTNLTAEHQKTFINVLEFLGDGSTNQAKGSASAIDLARGTVQWFEEGEGAELYVVFDPTCSACGVLYRDSREHLKSVKIRWIPIALGGDASARWLQSFISTADKGAALKAMFSGQVAPSAPISAEAQRAHGEALAVLKAAGVRELPLALYVDKSNVERRNVGLMTKSTFKQLADLSALLKGKGG